MLRDIDIYLTQNLTDIYGGPLRTWCNIILFPSRHIISPSREITSPSLEIISPSREITSPSREIKSPSHEIISPSREIKVMHLSSHHFGLAKALAITITGNTLKVEVLVSHALASHGKEILFRGKEMLSPGKEILFRGKEINICCIGHFAVLLCVGHFPLMWSL
jgi:hypothetical protein